MITLESMKIIIIREKIEATTNERSPNEREKNNYMINLNLRECSGNQYIYI